MRISCACGSFVVDDGSPSEFKAHLRPDAVDGPYSDGLAAETERIAREFAASPASEAEVGLKTSLEEFGMVGVHLERTVYECQSCGRLILSKRGGGWAFYVPDGESRGVLS